MLNGLLGQQLFDLGLVNLEELEGRVDDAVEKKGKVDEQGKSEDLQPLECLPAQAEGDDPDEERAAGVNGGAGRGGDAAGDGETEKVEATVLRVSTTSPLRIMIKRESQWTYPMLIMIKKLDTRTALYSVIWRSPSTMSNMP